MGLLKRLLAAEDRQTGAHTGEELILRVTSNDSPSVRITWSEAEEVSNFILATDKKDKEVAAPVLAAVHSTMKRQLKGGADEKIQVYKTLCLIDYCLHTDAERHFFSWCWRNYALIRDTRLIGVRVRDIFNTGPYIRVDIGPESKAIISFLNNRGSIITGPDAVTGKRLWAVRIFGDDNLVQQSSFSTDNVGDASSENTEAVQDPKGKGSALQQAPPQSKVAAGTDQSETFDDATAASSGPPENSTSINAESTQPVLANDAVSEYDDAEFVDTVAPISTQQSRFQKARSDGDDALSNGVFSPISPDKSTKHTKPHNAGNGPKPVSHPDLPHQNAKGTSIVQDRLGRPGPVGSKNGQTMSEVNRATEAWRKTPQHKEYALFQQSGSSSAGLPSTPIQENKPSQPTRQTPVPTKDLYGEDTSSEPFKTQPVARKPVPKSRKMVDLVQDSKLETVFQQEGVINIHTMSDAAGGRRLVKRESKWVQRGRIGQGGFGSVWLQECVLGLDQGKTRAVKEILKTGTDNHNVIDYHRELEAIAKFSNIKYRHCFVESYGWYEDEDKIFITMEYLTKGDLQQYVRRQWHEREVQTVTCQLLEGLEFMHENGFVHRDLKPANILVIEQSPNWWVKISDFGISKREEEGTAFQTMIGSAGYLAPELLGYDSPKDTSTSCGGSATYTTAVDLWALGAIVTRLLVKKNLFDDFRLLRQYVEQQQEFPYKVFASSSVTTVCIDFLSLAMSGAASERPSAGDALQHPWVLVPDQLNDGMATLNLGHGNDDTANLSHQFEDTNGPETAPSAAWSVALR